MLSNFRAAFLQVVKLLADLSNLSNSMEKNTNLGWGFKNDAHVSALTKRLKKNWQH